ncbi:MAG: hypothetical protein WCQ95_10715 [Bacteroidota bacterium]
MTSIVSILVFVLAAIGLFGFGLLLIMLGIVLKKPGQWVPGILVTFFSFVGGIIIFVFFIKGMVDSTRMNYADNYNYDRSYPYDDQAQQNDEKPIEAAPEETTTENIAGFIQDDDKSLIYIKVIPDVVLKDYGIKVEKIDTYLHLGKNKKQIPLKINFTTKCKGEMVLILFSSANEELGRSKVQVNQEGNTTFTMKFVFPMETNFLQTDHARLKISD